MNADDVYKTTIDVLNTTKLKTCKELIQFASTHGRFHADCDYNLLLSNVAITYFKDNGFRTNTVQIDIRDSTERYLIRRDDVCRVSWIRPVSHSI
jgi:hypothetical protein